MCDEWGVIIIGDPGDLGALQQPYTAIVLHIAVEISVIEHGIEGTQLSMKPKGLKKHETEQEDSAKTS